MTLLRHLPNALTIARCVLTIPMTWLLLEREFEKAFLVFFVAGLSDGLDGFLAKQFSWQSRFGAIADPLADKLMLICGFAALAWIGVLPWWLTVLVIGRDVVIVSGALAFHHLFGPYEMQPSILSKLNTLTQILFLCGTLVHLALLPVSATIIQLAIIAVTLTTVISGVHYVWVWGRRTASLMQKRKSS